tara:strand:+ start:7576 stop:8007 length:432 start_codon:yes stop_codon:yes gene_type:complete
MEISEYIRIKRNVVDVIQTELSGIPQKQVIEFVDLLENEIIKLDGIIDTHERINETCDQSVDPGSIEFDVDNITDDSKFYIGTVYTRNDLENECNEYFEKYNLDVDLDTLDPEGYHEQMAKAYNRMSVRKHHRLKKFKNQKQL